MTLVPRPAHPPHRCSFTLRDTDPEGFIQGQVLSGWDPSAAISASYLRQEARALGMFDAATHQNALDEIEDLKDQLATVTAERDQLHAKFEAIDVLASAGFQARKKPGRPVNPIMKEQV
jgi:hypothetical protein